MITNSWHIKFLNLAEHISTWSKDPSRKIGAVAVDENRRILATGYNGFPAGIEDSEVRLTNREEKYKYVVHAEMNCIYNAVHHGVSLKGATIYVTGLPVCSECAKGIIQAGITDVFMLHHDDIPAKWLESYKFTARMFDESRVRYTFYDKQTDTFFS